MPAALDKSNEALFREMIISPEKIQGPILSEQMQVVHLANRIYNLNLQARQLQSQMDEDRRRVDENRRRTSEQFRALEEEVLEFRRTHVFRTDPDWQASQARLETLQNRQEAYLKKIKDENKVMQESIERSKKIREECKEESFFYMLAKEIFKTIFAPIIIPITFMAKLIRKS